LTADSVKENTGSALKDDKGAWALILGGSSGLGLATAKKLASQAYNLIIVHRDRKADLGPVMEAFEDITSMGVKLLHYNQDATNKERQHGLIETMVKSLGNEKIRVLVHSIAKGNLKPMRSGNKRSNTLKSDDFALTIQAMATSCYDWVQLVFQHNLFADDARVLAFTSEGNQRAWSNYGAVSAAKAALEAIIRNIALEFAPVGIKANCIQAGVTETKSFQLIPGHEQLKDAALLRNPNNRLTRPEDVANVAYLLTTDDARWITGTVIKVDGGESLQ